MCVKPIRATLEIIRRILPAVAFSKLRDELGGRANFLRGFNEGLRLLNRNELVPVAMDDERGRQV